MVLHIGNKWPCTSKTFCLSLITFFSLASASLEPSPFLREVHIEYSNTEGGHFDLGHAIGAALQEDIQHAVAIDPELAALLKFTESGDGLSIFEALLADSSEAFPQYRIELEGMAEGASVPVKTLFVSNFREELLQFSPDIPAPQRRQGRCSTAYVSTPTVTSFGHNDDWDRDWRNASYFISGVETAVGGIATQRWTTWAYPTYLPGMDLSFNSHGVVYSVQSLFPKSFPRRGVGTAFIARHLLEANSLEDAVHRASDLRVAAAMVYNLGSTKEGRMVELEVMSGGQVGRRNVTAPSFHANEFVLLKTPQFSEKSSDRRTSKWKQLQPATTAALRAFLGDESDPEWPVYRTQKPPDVCRTEVTGIFDLRAATFEVWTTNPSNTPPVAIFDLPKGIYHKQSAVHATSKILFS